MKKQNFKDRILGRNGSELYIPLFFLSFIGMLISFLPTMWKNNGYFTYYGDFNSQQLMFYYHASEAIREGATAWDWGTDLGTSFVGSYTFYLLGSPFFWIVNIFPLSWVDKLIPWLLCLKTSVASVTAYAFLRRFIKTPHAAFVGAFLYAFSGFQSYNVFFNHFHDVVALFPLMLLGVELLVQDNRKGFFAGAVAINAIVNYFFFVGEVVFIVLYFIVRCMDKSFRITWKKFLQMALESILGVMISCFILIPACLATILNPRVKSYLHGLDMVIYGDNKRLFRIIQSFFMMSDMPARSNLLSSDTARWSSIAGYLPLFSMAGVIAFMCQKKSHWAKRLITISIICAFVPVLNTSFTAFNSSYYARWYYMPILIMCYMTAYVIDNYEIDLKKGFIPTAIVIGIFFIIGMLPKEVDGKLVYGEIAEYQDYWWIQIGYTVGCLVVLAFVVYRLNRRSKTFPKWICGLTALCCSVCMAANVWYGVSQGSVDTQTYLSMTLESNMDLSEVDALDTDDNTFYRTDANEVGMDNFCMYWGFNSMRCFHSCVSNSIMDFYTTIGQVRDVASRMEPNLYALRGLFSVKYYFNRNSSGSLPNQTIDGLTGFNYLKSVNGFDVYMNQYFIPMGFTFDYYMTDYQLQGIEKDNRPNALLQALVLDDEQVSKYAGTILHPLESGSEYLTEDDYRQVCEDKQAHSCYYFKEDTHGFNAKINLDRENLVFFSVPFDKGWSAKVNGQDAEIEKVSYGFMAVKCPAGDNNIEFSYKTYGMKEGCIISIVGGVIWLGYLGVTFYINKKNGGKKKSENEEESVNVDIDY